MLKASVSAGLAATTLQAFAATMESAAPSASTTGAQSFELDEITISELQQRLSSGKFTARSITEKYLGRIEAIDRHGPTLRSIIEVNPDALAIADALDK